jgi:very-short-patch-repair endonuclease
LSRFRPVAEGGFDRARRLRRDATEAEKALWVRLRNRGFEGLKFRRQYPIGRYIVDFCCEQNALVIELDGGQHADAVLKDAERTRYLESKGFRVVRFWNNDVLGNMEGALEHLRTVVADARDHTSPLGEGGARGEAAGG